MSDGIINMEWTRYVCISLPISQGGKTSITLVYGRNVAEAEEMGDQVGVLVQHYGRSVPTT